MENETTKEEVKFKNILEVASEACERAKPSSLPAFWAKRSCNKCYGRGIEGKIKVLVGDGNTITTEALCSCAKNKFERWRMVWIKSWLKENKDKPLTSFNTTKENTDVVQPSTP